MVWNYIGSFALGALGALFIVWLRWTGSMPRFSSSIEIQQTENEYEALRAAIAKKIDGGNESLTDAEVRHSDQLRDDVWRQRSTCFLCSAIMYVVLGGATAFIFVGLDVQNLTELDTILKLIAAGALWSSFYSFIDVEKAEKTVIAGREGESKTREGLHGEMNAAYEKAMTEANKKLQKANADYNELVDEYDKLKVQLAAGGAK
ncbi:MAG: hypothetical protein LUQ40_04570 [Methanomicrobiales archaeon]|nr:hypothetical protein [Methanomicrobiales archaeon]